MSSSSATTRGGRWQRVKSEQICCVIESLKYTNSLTILAAPCVPAWLRDIFGSHFDCVNDPAPTSSLAACVWIPLFPLRCEEARHEGLAACPTALLVPDTTRKLWQVSSLARHAGVKPGMTVSQAIGVCPALRLCEPDPVHYDEQFARLLAALNEVSPVVEPGELGLAYVGGDGLEGIFGGPEKIAALHCGLRIWIADCKGSVESQSEIHNRNSVGFGLGKFTAWVAGARKAAKRSSISG